MGEKTMEINVNENKESMKINKSSVGVGWEVKFYKKDNETTEQLIARLNNAHLGLLKEFPNGVKK